MDLWEDGWMGGRTNERKVRWMNGWRREGRMNKGWVEESRMKVRKDGWME